ncbi:DEAD/DEAH box helicase [Phormidium sp. CCY1219]|uniref:DEAD/DEAH box helicase n=1 Tax=Phormidium sp. CCY1219 TaxID=2886104 RepID=UPI002D1F3714|nr:SNF2-related protein [Phormidium sp. CCY1219]MEB3830288.1 DEAD/DEAH box helicase family protein [Phormidium sp. CCY1219]
MTNAYSFQFKPSPALQALQQCHFSPVEYYQARLDLFHLSILADYDQLVCLPSLTHIDKHWYQIETAKKVIKQMGGRALLADEVGLGKTIEAGLICKEYLNRGMIKSLLVVTPASLVSQWQLELEDKFGIPTITTDERQGDAETFWQENDRIIASINTAKHKSHFAHVTAREWDMVVVDEAHHLKNSKTLNWKLVNAIKKRFILMLTATPVQNTLVELYNLLTLLKPGLLKTQAQFKKEYVHSGNSRLPKNPEQLRQLMREVMVRNTRSLVDVKLPKRFASTITVTPSKAEQELYRAINAYLRQHQNEKGLDRLTRNMLLMRAGSSPTALADYLNTLSERFDHEEVKFLLKRAKGIKSFEKAQQLVNLLKKSTQKTLVFTTHRETQSYLARCLAKEGIGFAEFRGDMTLKHKDEAIAEFRESVPVLLASETGGEGRNIQFANAIVNYDLPWNPMRIEQRIGRIHRIGQTQDVFIFNFCIKDSIEEYILRILHDKINMFELVVGEIETILGNMEDEFDFGEAIMDIWLQNQSRPELDDAFDDLAHNLLKAKDSYYQTRELDEQIFGEDFEA